MTKEQVHREGRRRSSANASFETGCVVVVASAKARSTWPHEGCAAGPV